MSESMTITGLFESLPAEVKETLRKEALRTGRGIDELMREGLLAIAESINGQQKEAA